MTQASTLDEVVALLNQIPPEEAKNLIESAFKLTEGLVWVPNPGPQMAAYDSEADELFYGGSAGGGKTDLSIGLALTKHRRSLILRKYLDDARDMSERMLAIIEEKGGDRSGWQGQLLNYHKGNISIKFAGCRNDDEKQRFKGKAHDLKVFDEVGDFPESVYTFITAWTRSSVKGQRCRVICTGNPPTEPEGLWVIKRWGAWLDPTHPNPAKDGELRWYTNINEIDTEVDGPGPHIIEGKPTIAKSRTFIRALLSDNPTLTQDDSYEATLDALPEEYRVAYRDGRFDLGLKDRPFQAIPTAWVRAAQERWNDRIPQFVPMCAIGVDCSGGGKDPMVIASRYDGWYGTLMIIPGKDLPKETLGRHAAGLVFSHRRDKALVIVDMGGGYGGSLYETLREGGIESQSYKGSEQSTRRTQDGQLGFANKRSEVIWRFREALDPSQPNGSPIFLPPDQMLLADLCSPSFKIESGKIKIEPKEDVCERLGRSPDRGDAVVMAWSAGPTYVTDQGDWAMRAVESGFGTYGGSRPKVVMAKR
jgi:hypothetical protein